MSDKFRYDGGVVDGKYCFDDRTNYRANYISPSRMALLRDSFSDQAHNDPIVNVAMVLEKVCPTPTPSEIRNELDISDPDLLRAYSLYQSNFHRKLEELKRDLKLTMYIAEQELC